MLVRAACIDPARTETGPIAFNRFQIHTFTFYVLHCKNAISRYVLKLFTEYRR